MDSQRFFERHSAIWERYFDTRKRNSTELTAELAGQPCLRN
jgi:hypothetical protein